MAFHALEVVEEGWFYEQPLPSSLFSHREFLQQVCELAFPILALETWDMLYLSMHISLDFMKD
jgi:hypothetical protein